MKKHLKRLRDRFLSPVIMRLDNLIAENKKIYTQINNTGQINSELQYCYLDAFAASEYLKKFKAGGGYDFESQLEYMYSKFINPGDTVIDIGAHAGRHLSKLVELIKTTGNAIAFEPLLNKYKELCNNFPMPNVEIINSALSDDVGIMDFIENITAPEESGLKKRRFTTENNITKTIQVNVTTLDLVMKDKLARIDYIKLDAEGGEIAILNGARGLISSFRPIISIEYGWLSYRAYGLTQESLFDFCNEIHYIITDIFGNMIPLKVMWSELCDYAYWDFFLIPAEKIKFFLSKIHS